MQRFSTEEAGSNSKAAPVRFATMRPFPRRTSRPTPPPTWLDLKTQSLDRLNTYGWVNARPGIAHIPIDRAMDILAQTGLPKVAAPPESQSRDEDLRLEEFPHSEAGSQAESGRKP